VRSTIDGRQCSSVHVCLWQRPEQNFIVCSGKSEVEVTNNRTLHLTYCTVEANYWQIRSIAWTFCDSTATCANRITDERGNRRRPNVVGMTKMTDKRTNHLEVTNFWWWWSRSAYGFQITFSFLWLCAAVRQSRKHDENRRSFARKVRQSIDESIYCQVDIIKSLHHVKAGDKPQPSSDRWVMRI